jgi:hypothetical protein
MERGTYDIRIDEHGVERRSGACAKCGQPVTERQPNVVRYSHSRRPGGLFHDDVAPFNCAPAGPDWYSLDDEPTEQST